jgi:hypothetical protein
VALREVVYWMPFEAAGMFKVAIFRSEYELLVTVIVVVA